MMRSLTVILCWLLSLNIIGCSAANATEPTAAISGTSAPQESPAISDISSQLTSDLWTLTIGEPPFRQRFVYEFSNDGTYILRVYDDYPSGPYKGEWRLTLDDEKKVHLVLKNKTDYYYWLPKDCIIQYEKGTDSMLVSGGGIVGTVKLRRWSMKPGK
jgi:hypothetical protein